ncbi:response regulator transcription factor [Facklamia miroungae]|uniref:Two-component system, AgrA family, response regulator AgrA n=1 Tax=Facklamia miroungae TaxID=120956 RepID=A0A1G7PUS7_9LACT|nr:response regulator transcription factor [Facklamia miroungae]NKZ28839.1 response regulator transcription factor [Facklamia miroungae]SDF90072.1 two-component system, AgrA family, response regulator AgrA [Facklamia miroungae]
MSIFIFEDNIIQAQNIKRIVEEICSKYYLPFNFIDVTSKSTDIINKIPMTTYIPIYFLDIEIKGELRKGLNVAQEIRKYDKEGIIVFVTSHYEFAPISYQYMVSAFTFIDKSLSYNERYQLIEQCLLHYQARNTTHILTDDFIVENSNTTVRVPFNKVEYIKTDEPHRLVLVTSDRLIHFYGALKEIEILDKRLFRCHQSFVVNKTQILAFDAKEAMIVLKSGKKLPVSRRFRQKVRQILRGKL